MLVAYSMRVPGVVDVTGLLCECRRHGRSRHQFPGSGRNFRQRAEIDVCGGVGIDEDDGGQFVRGFTAGDADRHMGGRGFLGGFSGDFGAGFGWRRGRGFGVGGGHGIRLCRGGFARLPGDGLDGLGFRLRRRRFGQRRAVFHCQGRSGVESRAAHPALHPALRRLDLVGRQAEHACALRADGAQLHRLLPASLTQPSSTAAGSKSNQGE
jgi:hypothetical protein